MAETTDTDVYLEAVEETESPNREPDNTRHVSLLGTQEWVHWQRLLESSRERDT